MAKFKVLNKVTRRRALKVLGALVRPRLRPSVGIPRVFAQDKSPDQDRSGVATFRRLRGAGNSRRARNSTPGRADKCKRRIARPANPSPRRGLRSFRPQTAVVKATKLIQQDGCKFLMGEISGASTLALLEIAEREKTVMMTPYSSPEAVTGSRGTRYQFRTYSNAYIQAAVAVDYMTKLSAKNGE